MMDYHNIGDPEERVQSHDVVQGWTNMTGDVAHDENSVYSDEYMFA